MTFEILTVIVIVNALVTVSLWRSRKPEKLKKKFLKDLLHSKPITPKHHPPKAIGEDFPSLVSDGDRRFFRDFEGFAYTINAYLAEFPWRLQELPKTLMRLDGGEDPSFGRRFDVFHNQERIGCLEVSSAFYSPEKPEVFTDIQLEWPRVLSFSTIHELLAGVASHVCDPNPHTKEYFDARSSINRAIMEVMWRAQQYDEDDLGHDFGQLELSLHGSATWYLYKRQLASNESNSARG